MNTYRNDSFILIFLSLFFHFTLIVKSILSHFVGQKILNLIESFFSFSFWYLFWHYCNKFFPQLQNLRQTDFASENRFFGSFSTLYNFIQICNFMTFPHIFHIDHSVTRNFRRFSTLASSSNTKLNFSHKFSTFCLVSTFSRLLVAFYSCLSSYFSLFSLLLYLSSFLHTFSLHY